MSVLVRERKSGLMYVFVKGAPEMIHKCSVLQHKDFGLFIKQLSLEGYRTIAMAFKIIKT
jgi:magnesium-transporting ATPase (P-type)